MASGDRRHVGDASTSLEAFKRAAQQETDPAAAEQAWLRYYDALEKSESGEPVENSPIGFSARQAFESGNQIFQVSFDLMSVAGSVSMLGSHAAPSGAHSEAAEFDVNDLLNEIVSEGWYLHSMATSYLPESEVSRKKFWTTGEQTASTGTLIGTYVFLRDDDDEP
ncbi:hypothetical protein JTZ10_00010 [Gordonia rubripertincta]|uniref:DUF4177 domain-containing protein n=1 Tax=Gordonia rubripertincta TaxID=36822 RepID=A0AAW4FYM1_GORRU|nr:hypothetical protein [Gordonia rubripertincta]MBM7276132.1 hypothetical protein [Gordonia rubripertincta]